VKRNLLALAALSVALSGCSTVMGWFSSAPQVVPTPLAEIKPSAALKTAWSVDLSDAESYAFTPAVDAEHIYVAGHKGEVEKIAIDSGRAVWSIGIDKKLSAGVGLGEGLVLVGTSKGELIALSAADGKQLWVAQLGGEILAAPAAAEGMVVARTSDGRILGLSTADGTRKWTYQKSLPVLTVRGAGGVLVMRGAVFAGYPGGKLVALSLDKGLSGWEANVAVPRGATELERIADVVSAPVADERQVCAVAYQGRLACFDIRTGNPLWTRDVSSSTGLAMDSGYIYVTDDQSVVQAFDTARGASAWKQDKLKHRGVSAPLALDRHIAVADFEGVVHLLERDTGAFAARIATDGSGAAVAPLDIGPGFAVQTKKGGVFALKVQ
jgi:outer membrane protein assembly factor BamB